MVMGLVAVLVGIALLVWRRPAGRAFARTQERVGGPRSATTATALVGLLGIVWIVGGATMIVLTLT